MSIVIRMIVSLSLFFVLSGAALADSVVKDVRVEGNERIEAEAILRAADTEAGDAYDEDELSDDLEDIHRMGYFDDVRVEAEEHEDGMVVVFRVEEKSTLRSIEFSGNSVFEDADLEENIDISSGAILNIARIKRNISSIEAMYKERNY
ncbi:MAG: POTRA domain-containing protein, partial [Desulfosalsimonas sp.]